MQRSEENNKANRLTAILLIIYIAVLFWILLFKLGVQFSYMDKRTVNLIPFDRALYSGGKVDFTEIMLNVIIFIPLGVYVSVLFKRWTFSKKLAAFFLASFMFEALQYILAIGTFDITDIITNTFGGIIGLIIIIAIGKIFSNHTKLQRVVNIIALIGTLIMILLLVLLKLNMLPIKYQ